MQLRMIFNPPEKYLTVSDQQMVGVEALKLP